MKRYESRYCTFGVPDDWEPQPPFGFAEASEEEDRMSAQAMERWLEQPVEAQTWAEKEKEILPNVLDDFELLGEGRHELRRGTGDAHFLAYRRSNDDDEPIWTKKIYLTQGPLLVDFTVSRPEEDAPPDGGELLERIAGTLRLQGVRFLERYQPFRLFVPPADVTADSGAEVETAQVETGGERRDFPYCCVSLPAVAGWDLLDDDGDAVYRRSGAEIRLHRPVGIDNDSEVWLADRMEKIQGSESLLFGSDRGELEGGAAYAALVYEARGETRKWKTEAVRRTLETFVEDHQPLVWTLKAPESTYRDHLPTYEALITAVEFLEPPEWRTRMVEPWIDLTLEGGWTSEGPGVYFKMEDKLIVQTSREASKAPLKDLRPSIVDSLRKSIDTKKDFQEKEQTEKWRGADALKYSVDGTAATAAPMSIRSIWCTKSENLHGVVVLGQDKQKATDQFGPLMDAMDLP